MEGVGDFNRGASDLAVMLGNPFGHIGPDNSVLTAFPEREAHSIGEDGDKHQKDEPNGKHGMAQHPAEKARKELEDVGGRATPMSLIAYIIRLNVGYSRH